MEKNRMKSELCRILNRIGAFKFGAFRLTSGKVSPYYIDLRVVPSFPDVFEKISDVYVEMIIDNIGLDHVDRVAGIPIGGIPFASIVAYRLHKPFLYVRREKRMHGRERRVEGILMPGDRVILMDDLITSGGSLIDAAESIRSEGGVVTDAVVLLDREEGGMKNLAAINIKLHFLLRASEAADRLFEVGVITKQEFETIQKQVQKTV